MKQTCASMRLACLVLFVSAIAGIQLSALGNSETGALRTVSFPQDKPVGWLYVRVKNSAPRISKRAVVLTRTDEMQPVRPREMEEWKLLTKGQGIITVPDGMDLALAVGDGAAKDLSFLMKLKPDDLDVLWLDGTEFSDVGCQNVAHLSELTELDISSTKVSDDGVRTLTSSLNKLILFDLSHTQVGNAGLSENWNFSSLRRFFFAESNINWRGVRKIARAGKLEELVGWKGKEETIINNASEESVLSDIPLSDVKDIASLKRIGMTIFTDDARAHGYNSVTAKEIRESMLNAEDLTFNCVNDYDVAELIDRPEIWKNLKSVIWSGPDLVFQGPGLQAISQLPQLEFLYLYGDFNKRDIWRHFANMRKLKVLYAPINYDYPSEFTESFARLRELTHISSLPDLRHLDLPKSFTLPQVRSLDCYVSQNGDFDKFSIFPNLQELCLNHSDLNAKDMHILKTMDLRKLDLSEAFLCDADLVILKELPSLEFLNLSQTDVSDLGLEHLRSMKQLHGLCLQSTNVTDAGVSNLAGCVNLEELDLYGSKTNASFLQNLKKLTNLRILSLGAIQNANLKALADLPSIQFLNLSAAQPNEVGIQHIISLPNLQALEVSPDIVSRFDLHEKLPGCRFGIGRAHTVMNPIRPMHNHRSRNLSCW